MVNQEDAERNGARWVKGGEKQTARQVEILSEFDWKLGGETPARSMAGVSIGVLMRLFLWQQSVQEMDACLTLTFSDKLSKRIRSAAIHYI